MPASHNEIHVNDIGTSFVVTFLSYNAVTQLYEPVNISDPAAVITFYFKKPDETVISKNAGLLTDGTDGKAIYSTVDGDLDQDGGWKLQGIVDLPAGKWSSNSDSFRVYANLWT